MAQKDDGNKDVNNNAVDSAGQTNRSISNKQRAPGSSDPPDDSSTEDGNDGNGNGDNNNDQHPGPAKDSTPSAWPAAAVVAILLGIAIVVALFGIWDTLENWPTPEPPIPPEPATPAPAREPIVYPPEQFYILNELIVSGSERAIGERTSDLVEQGIISQTGQISAGQLVVGLDAGQCPGLSNIFEHEQDFVIERYTILDESRDVISLIQEIQSDDVTAEPNRVIGQPWEVEGSPWEVEGSPWEVEGSSGSPQEVLFEAEASAAPEQWAFGKHGIELPTAQVNDRPTGEGILIGVFDTLPFVTDPDNPAHYDIEWVTADWAPGSPMLTLSALSLEDDPDGLASGGGLGSGMINHGLFVAGLVHSVAPDSTIQLIRVLDKDNVGDMFTLTQSLYNFLLPSNRDGYAGAVINLSLGIRMPPLEARNLAGLPREIQALQDLITVARCSNVVVVAAAGNNSAKVSTPELPNLPAAWSSVIGVSASNINDGLSCFSNQGDIGAPGGDGRETDGPAEICRPRIRECRDKECPFAVIGPVSRTQSASTGFAYWTGSSFAAPMVSGLAAQVLDYADGVLTPADVLAIIECGATPSNDRYLGAGVINVQRTIDECANNTSLIPAK